MARPLRIEYPGSYHHVINRGNAGQNIFFTEEDMDLFLEVAEEVCELYGIEIHAFCLFIHNPLGRLDKAMKYLGGVYTLRFNHVSSTSRCPLFVASELSALGC